MLKSCISNITKSDSDLNKPRNLVDKNRIKECKHRSKQIEKELKKNGKIYKSTIKLLLLGTGESGKSTVLKQMRIIHISKFTDAEKLEKINDIKSNIRDSILSILDAMELLNIKLDNQKLNDSREFVYENSRLLTLQDSSVVVYNSSLEKLWDCIERLWKDDGVRRCAKRGNEYHLIDSAQYFLDRANLIRSKNYLPDEQDILRCRVLTTAISETKFNVKNINFHIFDVGGQRDQRRKWIQCFNQVTAIIFVVDISSFNMTLREDFKVNRLKEALQSFRQIWINRYLYHISIILFLNKYDLFVKKILDENTKLEDYFPEYMSFKTPEFIDKHLIVPDEDPEVTRAKMFILDQFIKITNEKLSDSMQISAKYEANTISHPNPEPIISATPMHSENLTVLNNKLVRNSLPCDVNSTDLGEKAANSTSFNKNRTMSEKLHRQIKKSYKEAEEESVNGKFCIPYFTCAVDTDNIKKVFKACSHILKKEHLEKCGLL